MYKLIKITATDHYVCHSLTYIIITIIIQLSYITHHYVCHSLTYKYYYYYYYAVKLYNI